MWLASLLQNLKLVSGRSHPARVRRRMSCKRPPQRRLIFETLEDRCVPAYNVLSVSGIALNNLGQMISDTAFVENGVPTELVPAANAPTLRALNNLGQVVGAGPLAGTRQAIVWDSALGMRDLGINAYSVANGINDAGLVTGTIGDEFWGSPSPRAFLWDSATGLVDLGTFGGTGSVGRDVNNSGQMVGWREVRESYGWTTFVEHKAFIYDSGSGTITYLGDLPETNSSRALDVNDAGQVIGISGFFTGPHGGVWSPRKSFIWQDGVMTDLGLPLPSYFDGFAINNQGQVLSGHYLWENGVVTDISTLVSLPAGWTLSSVQDINDAGWMIGWANYTVGTTVYPQPIFLVPDMIPTLSISDATVTELDGQTTTADFTVTRTGPLDQSVTVNYTTLDGMAPIVAEYRAIAGKDYVATSSSITFNPFEATKTISVTILGDTALEKQEEFYVRLSPAPGGYLADLHGRGLIFDNDVLPGLTISDVSQVEGNSGVSYFVFTVSLSIASTQTITVNYATANGTATSSGKYKDYRHASGTLTFAPGVTTQTIRIEVNGDRQKESNETFFVNLSGAVGAMLLDGQGLGTILNDD